MDTIPTLPFKQYIHDTMPYRGGGTREETGKKLYKLSSNENLLGPSPLALEAIRDNLHTLHEYRFENDQLLREAAAAHNGLLPSQVVTANSGMELLDLICRGFVEEGSEVILSSPTFMAYKNFANLSGGSVTDIPLRSPDFSLDVKGIASAVTDKTRLLFISNPNNPTGSLIPRKKMDVLMDILPEHVIIVYDEVYYHYVGSGDYPRAADYINQGRPVIGMHSFSKAYGLGGIRLGYAFSTPEIAGYLSHLRRPFMINTLSTVAGIAALQDTVHIAATQQLVAKEKLFLYRQMDELGLSYWKSEANFILFKSLGPVAAFVQRMLDQGVMVRSADVMRAKGCIRVTIGTREANEAFIDALKHSMETFL